MEHKPDQPVRTVEQFADGRAAARWSIGRSARGRSTWTYRSQQFVRRHATVVPPPRWSSSLPPPRGGIVMQRNRAVASEAKAVAETTRAKAEADPRQSAVAKFLTDLFKESDPQHARGASVTARELLERGATKLSTDLGSQGATRANLMDTIGVVYRALGMIDEAERISLNALDIRRRELGPVHPDIAQSLDNIGQLAREQTHFEQAEQYHREALAMRRQLLPAGDAAIGESLSNLALALRERGKYDEAKPWWWKRWRFGARRSGRRIRRRWPA
jgi:tetratricopeptide (TPR) repeat protein